jgi:VWFA-related protein
MAPAHMTIPRLWLTLSIALAAGAMSIAARPQSATQGQGLGDSQARIRTTVTLVVVPVTVKGPGGELIAGIREEEFRVFEDDVEQRISSFSTDAVPLSVVLLIDDDMKNRPFAQVQKSLVSMAGGFGESDEVAVARFDAFYTPVLDFTADNDRLITELKRMTLGSSSPGADSNPVGPGPTGPGAPGTPISSQAPLRKNQTTKHLDDALHAAGEALRSRDSGRRKLIVLVTDGVDARNNTYNYDATLRLLQSSDVSVYAIGVDEMILNRIKSVPARYAHSTGGDIYYAKGDAALAKLYTQLTEQARYRYTIGYAPTGTDRTKNYHSIEVRIRRPGLTLLTRDGYYLSAAP